jgi:hypothetical protein
MREKIYMAIYIAFFVGACHHVYAIMKIRWKAVMTRMQKGITPLVSNVLSAIEKWLRAAHK